MKKVLATIVLVILFLSGCQTETTMTTTDLIAADFIEQGQDVIRLNDRVYRLDQVVTVSILSWTPGPRVQKIASEKTL